MKILRLTLKSATAAEAVTVFSLTAFYLYIATFLLGISFRDDTDYLRFGTLVDHSWFISMQEWSPLYAAWFKLLALLCHDPVWRYFLSWGMIATFIAIIPWWMKMPGAWIYTFLVLSFPFLIVSPYVSLFAAALLLLGQCLVLRRKPSISGALAASCGVCFVLGFCRPEFDFGVFISAIATLAALAIEHRHGKFAGLEGSPARRNRSAIAKGFAVICLAAAMHYVLAHAQYNRSGIAFAQHYSVRASERGLVPKGDAAWNSDYTERTFGVDTAHDATHVTVGITAFARAKPDLFLRHVLTNLFDRRSLVLLVLVVAVSLWPWFRNDLRPLRASAAFFLMISVPPLADIVIIYPREHYAVLLAPALILLASRCAEPLLPRKPPVIWALACGFFMIWWLTLHRHDSAAGGSAFAHERLNLHRVQCARAVDQAAASPNPVIFDTANVPNVYLIHPRVNKGSASLRNSSEFEAWAAQTRPAWISVDADLALQYGVTPTQLDQFLQKDLRYALHPCPPEAQLDIYTNESR